MVEGTVRAAIFDESLNETLREPLPEVLVSFFGVITHLGDGAVLVVFATLLYWFGEETNRQKRALVIAVGLGALAISAGLKGIFVQPRPELAFAPAEYPGYSFPSAHALGAAAFYATLAAIAERGTPGIRYAIAAVVITLVATSRIVLGLHYLGDVVVGVAIGLLFVWLVLRDPDPEPGVLFSLAGLIALVAWVLGSTEFTTLTVGASVGATVAWYTMANRPSRPLGASILVLGGLLLPVFLLLRVVSLVAPLEWALVIAEYVLPTMAILEILGYAVLTAGILVVPAVAERLNDWSIVRTLQETLPFRGRVVDPEQVSDSVVPDAVTED